jgi:hypothetical protein
VREFGGDGGLHGYVTMLRDVSVSVSDASNLRDVDGLIGGGIASVNTG